MKNLSVILGCLSIFCGFACAFLAVGTVGADQWGYISTLQFWVQELIAVGLGGLSWVLYRVGRYFYLYY